MSPILIAGPNIYVWLGGLAGEEPVKPLVRIRMNDDQSEVAPGEVTQPFARPMRHRPIVIRTRSDSAFPGCWPAAASRRWRCGLRGECSTGAGKRSARTRNPATDQRRTTGKPITPSFLERIRAPIGTRFRGSAAPVRGLRDVQWTAHAISCQPTECAHGDPRPRVTRRSNSRCVGGGSRE